MESVRSVPSTEQRRRGLDPLLIDFPTAVQVATSLTQFRHGLIVQGPKLPNRLALPLPGHSSTLRHNSITTYFPLPFGKQ